MRRIDWLISTWICVAFACVEAYALYTRERDANPYAYFVLAILCNAEARRSKP